MALASTALIILDLLDMGIKINSRMNAYARQAEAEGFEATMEAMQALADESDDEFERLKIVYGK